MKRFTIENRLRPIRIAYFVAPNNPAAVLRAIRINSFLWGGHLNPIIPLFQRVPKHWREDPLPTPAVSEIIRGYVDAFDPDFLTFVDCQSDAVCDDSRHVVEVDSLLANVDNMGTPNYGVGYFEMARHFGFEELRFERRRPLHLVAPAIGVKFQIFLSSIIGWLPPQFTDVQEQLKDAYDSPEMAVSMDSLADCFDRRFATPMSLCKYGLNPDVYTSSWKRNCLYYLDANNLNDVVDFWNLRALGFNIVPVPKQAADQPGMHALIRRFVKEHFAVSQQNPEIKFRVTFMKGRSIADDAFQKFIKHSDLIKELNTPEVRVLNQAWIPRFWDRWSREHTDCDGIRFYEAESECEVIADGNRLKFDPLMPKFPIEDTALSVANELSIHTYADGEPMAEVLPQSSHKFAGSFGAWSYDRAWRFSADGPVAFPRKHQTTFGIPKAQLAVEEWLRLEGWDVETSSAGLATLELVKHFGGIYSVSRIAHEETIALLDRMSKGKLMTYRQLKGESHRIAKQRGFSSPDDVISTLMSSSLVALGFKVKCGTCGRHPWIEMASLRPVVECPECLRELSLPLHKPNEIEWAYRGTGPLVSLSSNTGAFSVLLTARFLSLLMHIQTTLAFGVELQRSGQAFEFDLGGFVRQSRFGRSRTRMILAECKSYNSFERIDIKRMQALGSIYPGAILLFACLRPALTGQERKLIGSLAKKGRRRIGSEEPGNPVIVLTGNELFATFGLKDTWSNLGGSHAIVANQLQHESDILGVCSVTQQIYLGMDAMDTFNL